MNCENLNLSPGSTRHIIDIAGHCDPRKENDLQGLDPLLKPDELQQGMRALGSKSRLDLQSKREMVRVLNRPLGAEQDLARNHSSVQASA